MIIHISWNLLKHLYNCFASVVLSPVNVIDFTELGVYVLLLAIILLTPWGATFFRLKLSGYDLANQDLFGTQDLL